MAPAATPAAKALLQALGDRPGASAAKLADGAGIGRSTANKLLVTLAAEGRVVREAGGHRDGRRLKGAQTRSCSVSVLMEETAEQVASMHSALLLLANDRQAAGLIWRL